MLYTFCPITYKLIILLLNIYKNLVRIIIGDSVNNEVLKEAIYSGIDGEAVKDTLVDVINKAEEKGSNPIQVKRTIETIAHMKKNVNSIPDKKYASRLVSDNSEKIKSALNDGITPNEIASTLMQTVQKANNRRTKSRLKFVTKLIVKMKQKELKLIKDRENQMEKGRQKVLTNN